MTGRRVTAVPLNNRTPATVAADHSRAVRDALDVFHGLGWRMGRSRPEIARETAAFERAITEYLQITGQKARNGRMSDER